MANARVATEVFGGYRFMKVAPVDRFHQGAKFLEIGEGTSEVWRIVGTREFGEGVRT